VLKIEIVNLVKFGVNMNFLRFNQVHIYLYYFWDTLIKFWTRFYNKHSYAKLKK